MGKGKRKNQIPSQKRNIQGSPKRVHPSIDSIQAPKVDKDNAFQVALDNKNFELAKKDPGSKC